MLHFLLTMPPAAQQTEDLFEPIVEQSLKHRKVRPPGRQAVNLIRFALQPQLGPVVAVGLGHVDQMMAATKEGVRGCNASHGESPNPSSQSVPQVFEEPDISTLTELS
jgi:hypothetical protein